jgi:hypothetical protein
MVTFKVPSSHVIIVQDEIMNSLKVVPEEFSIKAED